MEKRLLENKSGNKNRAIITNTLEIILCILLCAIPVVGLMIFTQGNRLYLYIRVGVFFLVLTLRGILSAIDIFKVSKRKAILRLILVFAFVSIFGYIAYISYITSPHL